MESNESVGPAAVVIALGHVLGPEAFQGAQTLVLVDTHASPLLERATHVLPARWFLEKAGTFTSHGRRVQRYGAVLEPRFEACDEGEILSRLGAAAGVAGHDGAWDVRAASKRLSEKVPAFEGIWLGSLDDQGALLK